MTNKQIMSHAFRRIHEYVETTDEEGRDHILDLIDAVENTSLIAVEAVERIKSSIGEADRVRRGLTPMGGRTGEPTEPLPFRCDPDESGGYDRSDPKHPDWHSVHADLWDNRDKFDR